MEIHTFLIPNQPTEDLLNNNQLSISTLEEMFIILMAFYGVELFITQGVTPFEKACIEVITRYRSYFSTTDLLVTKKINGRDYTTFDVKDVLSKREDHEKDMMTIRIILGMKR